MRSEVGRQLGTRDYALGTFQLRIADLERHRAQGAGRKAMWVITLSCHLL